MLFVSNNSSDATGYLSSTEPNRHRHHHGLLKPQNLLHLQDMVSKNPNPPEVFYLDPSGMALPGLGPFASSTAASASSSEDLSKKVRKPYTITKSRESWTEPEHDKFLEALQLFDRDWKKIEGFVGSKTVIQIRSHAQKYFLKVQKNGANEHLPPPRPKRKASHPYPQKASKTGSIQSPVALVEPGFMMRPDSSSILMSSVPGCNISSWTMNSVQTVNLSHRPKAIGANNCCSSTESHPRATEQGNNSNNPLRVLPDFTQVYTFIGSVFDPNTSAHLQKLKKMEPIDLETVLLLMRNLSINLTTPDLEDHRRLVSSHDIEVGHPIQMDTDKYLYGGPNTVA